MIKASNWNGKDLEGIWIVTYKIDGVRVLVDETGPKSRTNKTLHNIPSTLPIGDYECYTTDFKTTISNVRTHNSDTIDINDFYSLEPLDLRLRAAVVVNPSIQYINDTLELALMRGYEGLILRQSRPTSHRQIDGRQNGQDDKWLKVKPVITHDLEVIGYQEGTGRNEGRMGALLTSMGKIGTGFTDLDRNTYTEQYIMNKVIEVQAMQVTDAGKLRHPRFIRLRLDKST